MIRLIDDNRQAIDRLCVRYRVRRLEVFGSATTASFDSTDSDLDFLVEFLPLKPGEHADTYFGLLAALKDLFERPIDLVMASAVRNPYFLEAISRGRTLLYAA